MRTPGERAHARRRWRNRASIGHPSEPSSWTLTVASGRASATCLNANDDGRGFDPSGVPPGHLGITGMVARAERLAGRATLSSTIGEGSRLEVRIPLA
jgi:signal transduction histidine kinase